MYNLGLTQYSFNNIHLTFNKNDYEYKYLQRLKAIESNLSHIKKQDIWSMWRERGKIGKFSEWHLMRDISYRRRSFCNISL